MVQVTMAKIYHKSTLFGTIYEEQSTYFPKNLLSFTQANYFQHKAPPPPRVCQVNVTNFFHFSYAKIAETRITSWGVWFANAKSGQNWQWISVKWKELLITEIHFPKHY